MENIELLSAKDLERRLQVTQNQINLFERILNNAKSKGNANNLSAPIYDAMITGYESQLDSLKQELAVYTAALKADPSDYVLGDDGFLINKINK
jgi:hypothetical protein